MPAEPTYDKRVVEELARYREVENVHDLPAIYHYWSERYLDPKLAAVGISFDRLYADPVVEMCEKTPDRKVRVVSLGSGNGDTEVALAGHVIRSGHDNFEVACVEMNEAMQERAKGLAEEAGIARHIRLVTTDLNGWTADGTYDVVMASHSLHHVVELEHVFAQVAAGLDPDGVFVVNDMIGRNGHMRWPEALRLVRAIWAVAPDRYKFNQQRQFFDAEFTNIDCSTSSFEGIRSQDILPLLLERFHPERFCGFANVIDVFIDRGYGHNFDPASAEDQRFIERVAQLDDLALDLGVVKPTHLIATFRMREVPVRSYGSRDPWFCVRDPERTDDAPESVELRKLTERTQKLETQLARTRSRLDGILRSRTWRYSHAARAVLGRFKRSAR